jgi:putative oxidoreductase
VVSTRRTTREVDIALIVVRVALTWIFFYYGTAKLFGWFNGAGVDGTASFFANTAHLHPGRFFAIFGGLMELGGAIAMAAGLASRLVGIALVGDMVMAMITVTWGNGIHSLGPHQGYEINVALAGLALVVVLLGAGRFSLDALAEERIAPPEHATPT